MTQRIENRGGKLFLVNTPEQLEAHNELPTLRELAEALEVVPSKDEIMHFARQQPCMLCALDACDWLLSRLGLTEAKREQSQCTGDVESRNVREGHKASEAGPPPLVTPLQVPNATGMETRSESSASPSAPLYDEINVSDPKWIREDGDEMAFDDEGGTHWRPISPSFGIPYATEHSQSAKYRRPRPTTKTGKVELKGIDALRDIRDNPIQPTQDMQNAIDKALADAPTANAAELGRPFTDRRGYRQLCLHECPRKGDIGDKGEETDCWIVVENQTSTVGQLIDMSSPALRRYWRKIEEQPAAAEVLEEPWDVADTLLWSNTDKTSLEIVKDACLAHAASLTKERDELKLHAKRYKGDLQTSSAICASLRNRLGVTEKDRDEARARLQNIEAGTNAICVTKDRIATELVTAKERIAQLEGELTEVRQSGVEMGGASVIERDSLRAKVQEKDESLKLNDQANKSHGVKIMLLEQERTELLQKVQGLEGTLSTVRDALAGKEQK